MMKNPFTFALCLLLFYAPSALAVESGGVDSIGQEFVNAINTQSPEVRQRLARAIFSDSVVTSRGILQLASLFERLHTQMAPMTYHHAEVKTFQRSTGPVYVMHIYARKEGATMWSDFQLYVMPPPVPRIISLAFIAEVSEPVSLPNGSLDQNVTVVWLNEYIDRLQRETDLSGSLLIARGDRILVERTFGFSDQARKHPVDAHTLFGIASGGKMFTALAIAQLVEAGKLRFEDPLTLYLSGFGNKPGIRTITIAHLLSHTSGIAEYWTEANDSAVDRASGLDDYLDLVYRSALNFESGTDYQYSNSNYILLGAIIEKITGESYFDYVQKHVITKAGLTETGYFSRTAANMAEPLGRGPNGWAALKRNPGGGTTGRGSPAGGAWSNARDMLKFSLALTQHRLVSVTTMKQMTTSKTQGMDTPEAYGFGFILEKYGQEDSFGHGGTAPGVNFEYRYFPNQDITLVVFSNQNNGAFDDLKRNAIKLISGDR